MVELGRKLVFEMQNSYVVQGVPWLRHKDLELIPLSVDNG